MNGLKNLSNEEKKNIIVTLSIIMLVSLLGILYGNFIKSQPRSYTVGTILKVWKPTKGQTKVNYRYSVNTKTYEGNVNRHPYEKETKAGNRFLVWFPKEYHHESFMMLDHPVPDGIDPPSNGWDEIPEF